MSRLGDHIRAHPIRLLITVNVAMFVSLLAASASLFFALSSNRDASMETCRAVNELRRDIYITAADLGVAQVDLLRFLPTEDCEALP